MHKPAHVFVFLITFLSSTASFASPTIEVTAPAPSFPESIVEGVGHETFLTKNDVAISAPLTVDNFLRQIPSFAVFRRSGSLLGHPTTQGVSLRGTGANGASRTLVLLDGIPLNDAFGGWVNWSRIPVNSIERIEVLEGWGSYHWSGLSLGSIIDISTSRPGQDRSELKTQFGTRNTHAHSVNVAKNNGERSVETVAEYFSTDGYQIVSAGDRGLIDTNATAEHGSISAKYEQRALSDGKVRMGIGGFTENRSNGTPLTANNSDSAHVHTGFSKPTSKGSLARANFFAQAQTFESTFSSQSPDRQTETPALDQYRVPAAQFGFSSDWTTRELFDGLLAVGGDVLHRTGETNERFRFIEGDFTKHRSAGGDQTLTGLHTHSKFFVTEATAIDAGARASVLTNNDFFREERDRQTGAVDSYQLFTDNTDALFEPKAQIETSVSKQTAVRMALYRANRVPTINELSRPFRVRNDITEANALLVPETLTGLDLGVSYERKGQVLRLTAFTNSIDDPVTNVTISTEPGLVEPCGFVPEGGVCRQRQNLGRQQLNGVEATVETPLSDQVTMKAGYLLSAGEIEDAPGAPHLIGNEIPHYPRHKGVLRAVYQQDEFSLMAQAQYMGTQFEDDENKIKLPQQILVDISARQSLSHALEIFLNIDNLFGEKVIVARTADGTDTIGSPLLLHGGLVISF